jgi:hypothetical protein
VAGMPLLITSHKQELANISKEIERLRKLYPDVQAELAALIAKHPEYPALFEQVKAEMTND